MNSVEDDTSVHAMKSIKEEKLNQLRIASSVNESGEQNVDGKLVKTVEIDANATEKTEEKRKRYGKRPTTERELKRLAFDNKKFNVEDPETSYSCGDCGSTFHYEVQLQSHSVYMHLDVPAVSAGSSLRYRCTVCSRITSTIQTYLRHIGAVNCKSEKCRLKALDSCVCLLCGFATTRNQLSTHLRDLHSTDASLLPAADEVENIFSCPICALDGSSVAVATGIDLLLHLSTWHPTAVVLEHQPRKQMPDETGNQIGSMLDGITELAAEPETTTVDKSGHRFCFRCRTYVPNCSFSPHRRECKKTKNTSHLNAKKKLKWKPQRIAPLPPNASSVVSTSRLSSDRLNQQVKDILDRIRKADANSKSDAGAIVEGIRNAGEGSSSSTAPKPSIYSNLTAICARIPRPYRKPYKCTDCGKEFPEQLGFFIHCASQYCHGNRGGLTSPICPLCNEEVKTAQAMLGHVRRRHCDADGLNVDKSAKIELTTSELASEIIGFKYICRKCSRGFYANTRCNSMRSHLGSKIPVQQVLICNICSRRVKSPAQLTLHLWAIHCFGLEEISRLMVTGYNKTEKMVRLESISSYFSQQTYEGVKRMMMQSVKDAPFLLKCSSCTTRFASLAALEAHNKVFHTGFRRDDGDFQLVAKVFFYRQRDPNWNDGSLFDEMLANSSKSSVVSGGMAGVVVQPSDETSGLLPVYSGTAKRKRRRLVEGTDGKADQAPQPAVMPRLIRLPVNDVNCKQPCAVITLDDDSAAQSAIDSTSWKLNHAGPPNVCLISPSSHSPGGAAGASATGPMIIRAFSMPRPPVISQANPTSAGAPFYVLTNNNLQSSGTPPGMGNVQPAGNPRITPLHVLRFSSPYVISVKSSTSSTTGTTSAPRFIVRTIKPPTANEQTSK